MVASYAVPQGSPPGVPTLSQWVPADWAYSPRVCPVSGHQHDGRVIDKQLLAHVIIGGWSKPERRSTHSSCQLSVRIITKTITMKTITMIAHPVSFLYTKISETSGEGHHSSHSPHEDSKPQSIVSARLSLLVISGKVHDYFSKVRRRVVCPSPQLTGHSPHSDQPGKTHGSLELVRRSPSLASSSTSGLHCLISLDCPTQGRTKHVAFMSRERVE